MFFFFLYIWATIFFFNDTATTEIYTLSLHYALPISASIVDVLTIFYTLLGVTLFVPLVGGLYVARTTTREVWPATIAGVTTMLVIQVATSGRGWGSVTPALGGLLASITAWAIGLTLRPTPHARHQSLSA